MEFRLTEQEALALYRIILRWDESGSLRLVGSRRIAASQLIR